MATKLLKEINNNDIMFSIVIPVYNSEKYLNKCIDSILLQTYTNYEIILVNDCSTDLSDSICNEYKKKYSFIKYISRKESGGTSQARNDGIKIAKGDYITFMDNDDYWDNIDSLKIIKNRLIKNKADVLVHRCKEYYENINKLIEKKHINLEDKLDKINDENKKLSILLSTNYYIRAVWTKVVKREIILENKIFFPVGMRNEDTLWSSKILFYAKKFDCIDLSFYVYRKCGGNAQTDKPILKQHVFDLRKICFEEIEQSNILQNEEKKHIIFSYFSYVYSVLIGQMYMLYKKNKVEKDEWLLLKKYAFVLKYGLDPISCKIKHIYKIFGFSIVSKLLGQVFINKEKNND